MDETEMKERNYRQVMSIRHKNEREQRKLDNILHSKHGIKAIHKWHMEELNMERDKLMKEMINVNNMMTTTCGYLPPRPGQEGKMTASRVDPIEKLLAAQKMMQLTSKKRKPSPVKTLKDFIASDDEVDNSKGTEHLPIQTSESGPGKLEGIANVDVQKAKENVFARLTSNKRSTRARSSSLESVDEKRVLKQQKRNTSRSPPRKPDTSRPNLKPPTGIQKPEGQASVKTKVVTISVISKDIEDIKEEIPTTDNTAQGDTKEAAVVEKAEIAGRPLSPIKEGTTLTEKSGPGGKKLSNRQYSFARSSTKGSIQVKGRKRKNTAKSNESEEVPQHNPDGSLRTVHTLPNFQESIEEAMNARYLRMSFKPWFEREISVSDVWTDRDKPLAQRIRLK